LQVENGCFTERRMITGR